MKLISSTIAALAATSALAKVVDLNSENFDSTLKNKDLAIVKFFAPWCGHCKMMAEDWEKASNALADNDKVLIGNVDCTEERELCSSQSVQGYPTLRTGPFLGHLGCLARLACATDKQCFLGGI